MNYPHLFRSVGFAAVFVLAAGWLAAHERDVKALRAAVRTNDSIAVEAQISGGANPQARQALAQEALRLAVSIDKIEICRKALDLGANPNGLDDSDSPVMATILQGKLDMLKLLIGKGANCDVTNNIGETALCTAVVLKRVDCVKALVEGGANVSARSADGKTPLRKARLSLEDARRTGEFYANIVKERTGQQVSQELLSRLRIIKTKDIPAAEEIVALLKQAGAKDRGEGSNWDKLGKGLKGPLFVLFALGVCMGPIGFWYLRKALVSRHWPATDGKVVDSTVSSVTRYRSKTYVVYVPVVKYTYEVDGEQFENDTVCYGGWNSNRIAKAKAVCERYPVDDAVKVYYNPKRPAKSVLEPGRIVLSTWIMSALGAYALAAMLVWLLIST